MAIDDLQRRLEAMSDWRCRDADADLLTDLRKALRDRSSLIVAKAAQLIGERAVSDLIDDLRAAFERLTPRGASADKGCCAKQAIIESLLKLQHDEADIYRRAAGIVQMEPVWGGQVDTAATMRGLAAMGLANSGADDVLLTLAGLLSDPQPETRAGAARALAVVHPPHAAAALLHLRTRSGEAHPEVLAACFESMLALDPAATLPLIEQQMHSDDEQRSDAAVLALGQSRRPQAFGLLQPLLEHTLDAARRRTILLAIAMLRHEPATAHLLELIRSGGSPDAAAALEALQIHQHDPALRQQVRAALKQRGEVERAVADAARWLADAQ